MFVVVFFFVFFFFFFQAEDGIRDADVTGVQTCALPILIVFTFFFSVECKAWGLLGHRVVGEVASKHLNETARHKVQGILGNRTLAEVSNWMDEIKSDKKYDSLKPWHYVTIPNGMKYSETNVNPKIGRASCRERE